MPTIKAAITAVGGYVPDYKLTNAELEKIVDTNDEWIRTRTGIEERRILKGDEKGTSDMVVPAVLEICRKRGIDPKEIDCLIVGTVTPDMVFPSTANIVCAKIGATNAWGYDLSAACSGFLYALTTGAALIESGRYKKVIVAGADKMSAIVDYTDRSTCIIFGDGADNVGFAGKVAIKRASADAGFGTNLSHCGLVKAAAAKTGDGCVHDLTPPALGQFRVG